MMEHWLAPTEKEIGYESKKYCYFCLHTINANYMYTVTGAIVSVKPDTPVLDAAVILNLLYLVTVAAAVIVTYPRRLLKQDYITY